MTDLPVQARTVRDFCRAYGVSRSRAYLLLAAGKIRAVKDRDLTLILEDSAREWLANLPPHSSTYRAGLDLMGRDRNVMG
jgi:hypothetical protein